MNERSVTPFENDRRRFQRILFDAQTSIRSNGRYFSSTLIDISLKGILVRRPEDWPAGDVGVVDVVVTLDDGNAQIQMGAALAHRESDRLGFRCEHIDMESISHLRRLVELNLRDPDLLERELNALIHQH